MMNHDHIDKMKHSPVYNYIVPGLTSWLIGEPSKQGLVRLFECERDHQENICPHSHRYDFQCIVLSGMVKNTIWIQDERGDPFVCSLLGYKQNIGQFNLLHENIDNYVCYATKYSRDENYFMSSDQVHSISFSKGSKVLFLQGPQISDTSLMLEPYVNGKKIPTGNVHPWMFEKGEK